MTHPIGTIYAKEVRTLLRDHHTLVYSVLVPLFLYPVVLLVIVQLLSYTRGVTEREESGVGFAPYPLPQFPGGEQVAFVSALEEDERLRLVTSRPASVPGETPSPTEAKEDLGEGVEESMRGWLAEPDVDVVLRLLPPAEREAEWPPFRLEIYYDGSDDSSIEARRRVELIVESYRDTRLAQLAASVGEGPEFLAVLAVESENLATTEEFSSFVAASVLPLLMILMIALGALYPALDSTVGEKERRTLETTLVSPVTGVSLVLGKYLAVVTFALVAFLLNLGSMALTLSHLRLQLEIDTIRLGWLSILLIVAGAILLSVFLSAVITLLAFLARSFKEGQTYVSPVYFVAVLCSLVSASPETVLTPTLAWVPLVNIVLLFREALLGRFPALSIAIALLSSCIYAVVALAFAVRVLRQESVATGSEAGFTASLLSAFGGRR